MNPVDRFWSKVDKTPGLGPHGQCWEWRAGLGSHKKGRDYGQFWAPSQRMVQAHRFAYEIEHGPIPEGLAVLHHCDNPRCVNPHGCLFLGTLRDNTHDMMRKGRHRSAPPCGERARNHKLTTANVLDIRARYEAGTASQLGMAREFGVSGGTINAITARRNWKHLIANEMNPKREQALGVLGNQPQEG